MRLNKTTRYRIYNQDRHYFFTFTVFGWIDLFTRKRYKDILIESFKYCQENKGLLLFEFVIMSNHIHLIAKAKEGYRISDIVRDLKKYTSKELIRCIHEERESRREWLLDLLQKSGG